MKKLIILVLGLVSTTCVVSMNLEENMAKLQAQLQALYDNLNARPIVVKKASNIHYVLKRENKNHVEAALKKLLQDIELNSPNLRQVLKNSSKFSTNTLEQLYEKVNEFSEALSHKPDQIEKLLDEISYFITVVGLSGSLQAAKNFLSSWDKNQERLTCEQQEQIKQAFILFSHMLTYIYIDIDKLNKRVKVELSNKTFLKHWNREIYLPLANDTKPFAQARVTLDEDGTPEVEWSGRFNTDGLNSQGIYGIIERLSVPEEKLDEAIGLVRTVNGKDSMQLFPDFINSLPKQ